MSIRLIGWRCCLPGLLIAATAPGVGAQDARVSVGAAYQVLDGDALVYPVGFAVDVSISVVNGFSVIGETAWSRNTSQQFGLGETTRAFDAAGGLRWVVAHRALQPYAQLVLGAERETIAIERFGSDAATNLLLQPGGGVLMRLSGRHQVLVQIDWRHVRRDERSDAVRYLFGLRFAVP